MPPITHRTPARLLVLPVVACAATAGLAQPDAEPARSDRVPSAAARDGAHSADSTADALAVPPKLSFFVEGGMGWSFGAELDDSDGEIDVARLGVAAGLSYRLNQTTQLIMKADTEFSFYEFDDAAGIIPSMPAVDEPWDDVHQSGISVAVRSGGPGWNWAAGGRVESSGESGADFGDTLSGGGFALASYDVSENLRLGAGVSVSTRLEGGVFVFPLPVIEWDVTDTFRVGTVERGVGAVWTFHPAWKLGLEASFLRREYRLADDNAVSEGSFTDRRVPVTLGLTYAPSPRTVITGRVGSEVWGELEINDANDDELVSDDLSPSLVVGLDVRIAF